MFGYDWTYLLVLPAALFAMYAQFKVSGTFKKFSETSNAGKFTGADAARLILQNAGIDDVNIESVKGNLTDHYDPRDRTLRLSEPVYGSRSLSAIGVAAHEAGHAIQHQQGYAPLGIRSAIAPIVGLGSNLAMPVVLIGLLLTQFQGEFGMMLLDVGILLFSLVVVFSLITLPVEFNASKRAVGILLSDNILAESEITPVRKVLNAAAMTYVASAAVAVMNLIRIIIVANGRRRN